MKRAILGVFILLGIVFATQAMSADVIQKKIVTIGAGETLDYGESFLLIGGSGPGCIADDYMVVTRSMGSMYYQWFTYDKKGRKGPFKRMTSAMLKKGAGYQMPALPYYTGEFNGGDGPVEYGNDASYIKFKGKKLGPFEEVRNLCATADMTKFFAVASKKGKWHLIGGDGRDTLLDGEPMSLVMSPDGTRAIATCMPGNASPMDAGSFQNAYIYTNEGKKTGPIKEFGDIWFMANSNHWVYTAGNRVYYDGALLKKTPEGIDKSTFWIDDTSHYAWCSSEGIHFSDGTTFPYPVMMGFSKQGGKTVICWVSVKKNGDVMVYSRAL
jgi:hypothetical protein